MLGFLVERNNEQRWNKYNGAEDAYNMIVK